jgi:FtsH-binding integral membrane protein
LLDLLVYYILSLSLRLSLISSWAHWAQCYNSLGGLTWLIVMLTFWAGTYYAQKLASVGASRESQYAGLGLYVFLEALTFIPLISVVAYKTGGNAETILIPACALTGALVLGLTLAVQFTQVDFSFLRIVITIGSICAIGAIIMFAIMGINPGTWFALAMILLMATVISLSNFCNQESLQYRGLRVSRIHSFLCFRHLALVRHPILYGSS